MNKERRIRERAYQIWESEGKPHGRDDKHWRRAETEVEQELAAPSSSSGSTPAPDGNGRGVSRPVKSHPIVERAEDQERKRGQEKRNARTGGGGERSS
jgi:hypothetical protein